MSLEPEIFYDGIFIKKNVGIHLPNYLFHYTSKDSFEKIQQTKIFRMSKFDMSNDKFEFKYGLNLSNSIMREICSDKNSRAATVLCKFLDFFDKEQRNPQMFYYMGCFCIDKHNEYLKKFYGDHVISFKFDIRLFKNFSNAYGLVIYSEIVFKRYIKRIINGYVNIAMNRSDKWKAENSYEKNFNQFFIFLIRDLFLCSAFFKKNKFNNEREFRIIIWGDDPIKKYYELNLDKY